MVLPAKGETSANLIPSFYSVNPIYPKGEQMIEDEIVNLMSKQLKRKGIDLAPEQIKLAIAIGEYLDKHPSILKKVQKEKP